MTGYSKRGLQNKELEIGMGGKNFRGYLSQRHQVNLGDQGERGTRERGY